MKSTRDLQTVVTLLLLAFVIVVALNQVSTKTRNLFVRVNSSITGLPEKGQSFNQAAPQFRQQAYSPAREMAVASGAPPFTVASAWQQAQPIAPTETKVTTTFKVSYTPEGKERVERIYIPTYEADFKGEYTIVNETEKPVLITLQFPFPQTAGTLSKVDMMVDGHAPAVAQYRLEGINWSTEFKPKEKKKATITYQAKGVQDYRYVLDHAVRYRRFAFAMQVQGVDSLEFPKSCMTPTGKEKTGESDWTVEWNRDNLITKYDIGIDIPIKPSLYDPWKQLANLTRYSPLLMLLFLACVYSASTIRGSRSAVQHYPLLGIGFFLYYPLMLYLAVHLPFQASILIGVLIVVPLVLYFTGKLVAPGFASVAGVIFLLIFYILPPEAQLFTKFRTLLILGAVLGLIAYFMVALKPNLEEPGEEDSGDQDGGEPSVEESEDFPPAEAEQAMGSSTAKVTPAEGPHPTAALEPEAVPSEPAPPPLAPTRFCAYCGAGVKKEFSFCPTCGKGQDIFLSCCQCGQEFVRSGAADFSHCPACGAGLKDEGAPVPNG